MKKIMPKKNCEGIVYLYNIDVEDRVNLRLKGYKIEQRLTDEINLIIISKKVQIRNLGFISQYLNTHKKTKLQYIQILRDTLQFAI